MIFVTSVPVPAVGSGAVRYVGVDLAWGQNGTTGLAVLDEDGRLLDATAARTDEEIEAWAATWAPGRCMVAFDAPLVVRNPSGQRACERLVGRHFGRHRVYCHSSNTSNPQFADGGRAMRLAGRLRLDVDPASTAGRRALEVYPHTAIVVLLELPERLRYKAKPGRDTTLLRSEMLRLLDGLEALGAAEVPLRLDASTSWARIRRAVTTATRKAHLAAVEDAVDAVVCAYVAALRARAPDRTRVLGTVADGYIVTPVTEEIARRVDAAGPGRP